MLLLTRCWSFLQKSDIKYLRIHWSVWPSGLEGRILFSENYELKFCIKGDSGGNVNIMGGDSIGQCENKDLYKRVYIWMVTRD